MGELWRRRLNHYKGMQEGCAPGTQEKLVELILRNVPARSGVLDLGARHGALLARLRDHGFTDLCGIDLEPETFKLEGVPFHRLDLNSDFAASLGRTFNLVVTTDVIEHLDSPRHLLQQAHRLLADGGHIAVSLPNISCWKGRVQFALNGEHWGFGEVHYRGQRHISPMTRDCMRLTMQEVGFRVVEDATAGDFAGPLQSVVTAPARALLRLAAGPRVLGDSSVYLAIRADPDPKLRMPSDYDSWKRGADSAAADPVAAAPARGTT